jgi:hypothetical protein
VNVYLLVRTLIASRRRAQQVAQNPNVQSGLDSPRHILGWLILCEQWPYAAHVMLEILDQHLKLYESDLEASSQLRKVHLMQLYNAARVRIDLNGAENLKKLDLKHERLQSHIETHLADFTLADVQRLRLFTVNFNPALSAEVRLTLAGEGR